MNQHPQACAVAEAQKLACQSQVGASCATWWPAPCAVAMCAKPREQACAMRRAQRTFQSRMPRAFSLRASFESPPSTLALWGNPPGSEH